MRYFLIRNCVYAFVILTAIYVGSYYAMVERWEIDLQNAPVAQAFLDTDSGSTVFAEYKLRQEWLYSFYSPMHAIDRKLRPDFWTRSE